MMTNRDGTAGGRVRLFAVLCTLSLSLAACGAQSAAPAPDATATASAPSAPTATVAVPPPTETATPGSAPAGGPVSVGVSASRAPLFYYRGRVYWQVGFGRAGADAVLQADQPIGVTFSRWQSNGLAPAGATIYSVVDQPVERMLAVQGHDRPAFFAADRPAGLDSYQVVQGVVASFGPGRWTTPDGSAPPAGQKPSDPNFIHASVYTPATVKVERTLHGLIPAGGEIEVRQRGGTAGAVTTVLSTGGVIPLAPGGTVLLFLTPGQWSSGGRGETAPGDYYWLSSERAYAVADGQVTPLGVPDAAGDVVPQARFEAGIAETFGGVTPLDPHGPKPTPLPLPTPAPTPTPWFAAGQPVNPAGEWVLDAAQSVYLKGTAVPEHLQTITYPTHARDRRRAGGA